MIEEEWLKWRKKGLGGSDAAAALGLSPYKTARELYYEKTGRQPAVKEKEKSVTLEIGKLLEDTVARIFTKKTGMMTFRDTTMYQHPLYPVLIADIDRFINLPDGKVGILECKTAHCDTQYLWANGAIPRHYEIQVRHYMAVMNLDAAYIACLFSNHESDFIWRKVERDLDEEEAVILQLQDYWERYVLNRTEPPFTEKPDLVLDVLRRYYGPADAKAPELLLGAEYIPVLEKVESLQEQKKMLSAQLRQLDQQMKSAYAGIVDQMGTATTATCEGKDIRFAISFKPQYRESIPKDNLSIFKTQHPDLYRVLAETTESRIFKLKRTALV